jgi:hypothetical protein
MCRDFKALESFFLADAHLQRLGANPADESVRS